jgi:hypothetical protein
MFGLQNLGEDYLKSRITLIPELVLRHQLTQEHRDVATKYLNSVLRAWKFENAQYTDTGKLLTRTIGNNFLLAYLGLRETDKDVEEVEPWEVFDHLDVSSNLDLLNALSADNKYDETGLIESAIESLGESVFWSLALTQHSMGASQRTLMNAYFNFTDALYVRSKVKEASLLQSIEPMKKVYEAHLDRLKKFVRPANKKKAQILREKTNAYRVKHPNRARNAVATEFSKDTEIGLGITRIKEYYSDWYTLEQWPVTTAGRPKKSA